MPAFRAHARPIHATSGVAAPALTVRSATRRLGDRLVLDRVSLDVEPGRIVVLAGPNGAGKTSLLRAIAGRLRLDSGSIAIEGMAPAVARAAGRLGLVPQDIALYPHLSVRENLAVLGRLAGLGSAALPARVAEGLAWAGLTDRAGSIVRTLSGGMRRRVNLAAGVLHRPALLLLDEPTVGVDAESEARLHGLLRALRSTGIGVIVATHNLDEAAALCDDVVVMAAGAVKASGPLDTLIRDAFPHGRELLVTVDAGGVASAVTALEAVGFRRTGAHTWVRPAAEGLSDLGVTEQQLVDAGVRVAEARLSKPSLRGAIAVRLGPSGSGLP
jgi:ABC-2 type transport system ATP-binding protein